MSKGLFIALEGGEGSGKDTQIDLLRTQLDPDEVVFTREPGGTAVGEQIRAFLLNPKTIIEPEVELIGFLAARAILVETVIKPALAEGKTVISNRFRLSTIAYQIYGRQREHLLPLLENLSRFVGRDSVPHYILLDVDPIIGLRRVEKRGDGKTRFDAENLDFHRRVRKGYLRHYETAGNTGTLVDASRPVEVVNKAILKFIRSRVP